MVVVSGGWVKNAVSFPTNGDLIVPKMAARAVLICRPNSHPFQERTLVLDQPVKIGRSVARARAVPNNAIFDCKVLSRNHALLWYEKGKFYLQDTKSSNGTFVNNQRLSKGAEESPPREVCSGDIVQFGVDVMENARKVTHGCIVATLKLYLPDGKEAKASPSTSVVSSVGAVSLEDLYQLNQYLQEALQREQMLENKLVTLQHLVESTRQASELGWKALIDEDRLLSRVEILESQLQVSSKNFAEDKLREELRKLQEDKCQYQGTAKESLQKVLQEKLEAIQKLQALELNVSNSENECAHLKKLCERSQLDLQELAQKYGQQLQKVEELTSQLQDTDEQNREVCDRLEQEKRELQVRMEGQIETERELQLRLDALEMDGDMTQQKLAALQTHMNLIGKNDDNQGLDKIALDNMKGDDSTGQMPGIILERIDMGVTMMDNNAADEVESLQQQVKKYEEDLQDLRGKVEHLENQNTMLELVKIRAEEALTNAEVQVATSRAEEEAMAESTTSLHEQMSDLVTELTRVQSQSENKKKSEPAAAQNNAAHSPNQVNALKVELTQCQELLAESRAKKRAVQVERGVHQMELDCSRERLKKATDDAARVKLQLQMVQYQMNAKNETVVELQRLLVTSAEEAKAQMSEMQDKLKEEWERGNRHVVEAQQLKKELVDAQQEAKQSHNESEQMKDRLKAVQTELEAVRRSLSTKCALAEGDNRSMEELAIMQERCNALDQENHRLRAAGDRLECEAREMKDQAEALRQMQARYSEMEQRLSFHQSHASTTATAASTATPKTRVESASGDGDSLRVETEGPLFDLTTLEEELVVVKEEFTRCNLDKTQLANELKLLREEFGALTNTSYAVPVHYLLPMALALMAILVAYSYLV